MKRWILVAALLAVQPVLGSESRPGKSDRGGLPKIFGEASRPSSSSRTSSKSRKEPKYEPPPFTLTLPSGTELTQARMDISKNELEKLFPKDASLYLEKFAGDKVRGIYTYSQGRLDGPAAVLHEDESLAMLASYAMSSRDGTLRRWETDKRRLLYADYKRDKKEGLVCLFREDLPWFIQECDGGDVKAEYLVRWHESKPEVLSRSLLQGDDLREIISARTKLAELESQMERSESELKKTLREWYVDKEREIRKQKVVKKSAARRDEQRQREEAAQRNVQILLRNAIRGVTGR